MRLLYAFHFNWVKHALRICDYCDGGKTSHLVLLKTHLDQQRQQLY